MVGKKLAVESSRQRNRPSTKQLRPAVRNLVVHSICAPWRRSQHLAPSRYKLLQAVISFQSGRGARPGDRNGIYAVDLALKLLRDAAMLFPESRDLRRVHADEMQHDPPTCKTIVLGQLGAQYPELRLESLRNERSAQFDETTPQEYSPDEGPFWPPPELT